MWLVRSLSVIGILIGGVVLSMLIAQFYPSPSPLNRLYGAVFLSVFITMGLLVYGLVAKNWRQALGRSFAWWIIPLILLLGGWL